MLRGTNVTTNKDEHSSTLNKRSGCDTSNFASIDETREPNSFNSLCIDRHRFDFLFAHCS